MRWWRGVAAGIGLAVAVAGCGIFSRTRPGIEAAPGAIQSGVASWYGPGFHGRQTASGEIYDQYALTAAHQTLPHGTRLRVTNLTNDREVIVRINDRGPFVDDRIVDLSYSAARQIDMIGPGTAPVRMEVLDRDAVIAVASDQTPTRSSATTRSATTRSAITRSSMTQPATTAAGARAPDVARRYRVQVGTWADYERARQAQRSLASVGRAYLGLIETGGARYYQVRLGPFADHDDAADVARRIGTLGFPALVVVQ